MKKTHFRRMRPSLFQTRGRHAHRKSAPVESAGASLGEIRHRREEMEIDCTTGTKRRRAEEQTLASEEDGTEKEEMEKEEVERRIEALQRIVPGGDSLEVERLFEKTARYILCLQRRVKALRTLSLVFEGFDKEKTKSGC